MASQESECHDFKKRKIEKLLATRKSITDFFRKRSEELHLIKESSTVPTDYILEFARYTTFTLRAPQGWMPGMPLIGGHPPAPQPDQMRDGILQRYNQQRPIIDAPSEEKVMKEMKDIVKVRVVPKSFTSNDLHLKEVISAPIPYDAIKSHSGTTIATAAVDSTEVAADQQPLKRARQINISFGLSDSESSDDDGEK